VGQSGQSHPPAKPTREDQLRVHARVPWWHSPILAAAGGNDAARSAVSAAGLALRRATRQNWRTAQLCNEGAERISESVRAVRMPRNESRPLARAVWDSAFAMRPRAHGGAGRARSGMPCPVPSACLDYSGMTTGSVDGVESSGVASGSAGGSLGV
jgi:hypothetical protein